MSPANKSIPVVHAFLLRTGMLLHRHGAPSYRWEAVMTKVADSLGVECAFLYTPTAIHASMFDGSQERVYLRRVETGEVDIAKLLAFDSVLEDLEASRITLSEAGLRLDEAADAPNPYPLPARLLSAAIACAGVAVIFGGSLFDTAAACLVGTAIAWMLERAGGKPQGWLEPTIGFVVAMLATGISQWLPIDGKLVTLAALILPLPGFTLTVSITELALGHLSAGSARLAGACVRLFTLVLGVALAWRLSSAWLIPAPADPESLPWWALWIAFGLTPLAFAIAFQAPVSTWPVIFAVSVSGLVASRICEPLAAPEVGAFVGALVIGCGSNLYARVRNRPAMVPQTPALIILVPGSIGYQSLTAMVESDTLRGVELGFSMLIVAVALVGGLMLANLTLSPKRVL